MKWKQFNGKVPEYPCGTPFYVEKPLFNYVYTAGLRTGSVLPGGTTRKYDNDGTPIWTFDHERNLRAIASDLPTTGCGKKSAYHVYTGGDRTGTPSPQFTTRKHNSDSTLIWSIDANNDVQAITVDESGNVYTGQEVTGGIFGSPVTTRKYDSNGTLLWSAAHGISGRVSSTVNAIAVDVSGNVYTGGNRLANQTPNNLTTRKYDSNGTLLWSLDHGAAVFCIAADGSGNVYTGGVQVSGPVTTRKYDTNGTLLLSLDHGGEVRGITLDESGNIYTVGGSAFTTKKYDSSGTLIWSVNHGAFVRSVAVDGIGNVYTGGDRTVPQPSAGLTTRKYDSNGTLIWSVDHGVQVYGITTQLEPV